MGGGHFNQAGVFLIDTLISLYVLAFMLRVLLQLVRADYYNPVSQALVKITNPVLLPLRRIIPSFRGWDIPALLVMFALEVLKFVVIYGLLAGIQLTPLQVVVLSLQALIEMVLELYFFSILIQAVLSWVNPGTYSPITSILWTLNEPILRPIRRVLPPLGGIDFSPLVAMILLQVLRILIA
jgi:YggT family protein